jgi:hypothetical protein
MRPNEGIPTKEPDFEKGDDIFQPFTPTTQNKNRQNHVIKKSASLSSTNFLSTAMSLRNRIMMLSILAITTVVITLSPIREFFFPTSRHQHLPRRRSAPDVVEGLHSEANSSSGSLTTSIQMFRNFSFETHCHNSSLDVFTYKNDSSLNPYQDPYQPFMRLFHPVGYVSIVDKVSSTTSRKNSTHLRGNYAQRNYSSTNIPVQLRSARIAFVTAIVGTYEATCKKPVTQTIPADFIVYTNNPNIETHGIWKIVNITHYQYGLDERDKDPSKVNSLVNNQHAFNRAKFIKVNLHRLPELKKYDVIVWLDGTVKITDPMCAELVYDWLIHQRKNLMVYEHVHASLEEEWTASHFSRYISTRWDEQDQPFQDIDKQYKHYAEDEHFEDKWYLKYLKPEQIARSSGNIPINPMYVTCFLAFNMRSPVSHKFLDAWYDETLTYTTQDQITFVYVLFKMKLLPFSAMTRGFPNDYPSTQFFYKENHGHRRQLY